MASPISSLPEPARPARPTHSPAGDGEAHILDEPAEPDALDLEAGPAATGRCRHGLSRAPLAAGRRGVADHRRHHALLGHLRERPVGHDLAVAEDGDAAADLVDLLEVVGDIKKGHAARLQPVDALEQPRHLAPLELGRGLVQDHEARALQEGPGDLDDLALLDAQVLGVLGDVDLEAPLLEHLLGPPAERGPADPAAGAGRMGIEEEVLGDGEGGDHGRALVDAGHALAPGRPLGLAGRRLAREPHPALVGCEEAGEDADQGRLAGPVPADQGARVAGRDGDRDILERLAGAEALGDPDRLRDGRCGRPGTGACHRHPDPACASLLGPYFTWLPQRLLSSALALVTIGAGRRSIGLPLSSAIRLLWSVGPCLKVSPATAASR